MEAFFNICVNDDAGIEEIPKAALERLLSELSARLLREIGVE